MYICYCDACGNRVSGSPKKIEILCHLYSKRGQMGYVDIEFNRVSGKLDVVDVCNACYNEIMDAAVVKLIELKKGANKEAGDD